MSSSQKCKTCEQELDVGEFETYKLSDGTPKLRLECKKCRAAKRKTKVKTVGAKDVAAFALPEACLECGLGPDEVEFKFRHDTLAGGYRNVCNSCVNKRGYSQAYRKRQREVNEEAYLARNAATHLKWARANPDAVARQKMLDATDPDRKFKRLVSYAKAKGIRVDEDGREALTAKMTQSCFYCDFAPGQGEKLNGLDRVDSAGGYSDANTVPCCHTCNAMKAASSLDDFIHHIRAVNDYFCHDAVLCSDRRLPPAFGGRADLRAITKTKDDHLSREERLDLWAAPCYLCGREPSFGIDRVDSAKHYTPDNVAPCCTLCNYMKKDLSPSEFKTHVAHVWRHTAFWVLGDSTVTTYTAPSNASPAVPIGAFGPTGSMCMAFPSVGKAVMLAGPNVDKAVSKGRVYKGHTWRALTPSEYASVCFCAGDLKNFVRSL